MVIGDIIFPPVSLHLGVPQGSVLGTILFILYTSPLVSVINNHTVTHHPYADDTQLHCSASPDRFPSLLVSIQMCVGDIRSWTVVNKLKLSDD